MNGSESRFFLSDDTKDRISGWSGTEDMRMAVTDFGDRVVNFAKSVPDGDMRDLALEVALVGASTVMTAGTIAVEVVKAGSDGIADMYRVGVGKMDDVVSDISMALGASELRSPKGHDRL